MRRFVTIMVSMTLVLLVQLRAYPPEAISYPTIDTYDSDCIIAFFSCHALLDLPPSITDNQLGDDFWRSTNSGSYDVDFSDDAGLSKFETIVWTGPSQSGTRLQAWTTVSTLSGKNYTTNWALLSTTWTAMQQGTNYVSVRVTDSAAQTTTLVDAFYVRKDQTAPSNPTTVNDGTGGDIDWVAGTTSLSANWSGAADAHSGIADYDWCFTTNATNDCAASGRVAAGTNLAATSVTASSLSLTEGTAYYACVRARDVAGNIAGSYGCSNGQRPDTSAPAITDNQPGDTTWRSSNTGTYDVDFGDGGQLARFETQAWSGTGRSGTMLQDWTQVATLVGTSHTTNWSIVSSTWSALQEDTSHVSVRVFDAAGNSALLVDAFFVRKDVSPPTNPSIVNDGAGSDIDTQASSSTLEANWSAGSDTLSGVAGYDYCFSTTVGCAGTIVASGNTTATSVSQAALVLSPWTTYYSCVRTRDVAGNPGSAYACSDGVQVEGVLTVSVTGYENVALGSSAPGDTTHGETRVTVTTDAPGGYMLALHDSDGNGAIADGSNSVAWNISGTVDAPAAFSGTGVAISAFGGSETPARWCSGGQVNCTAIDDVDLLWAGLTGSAQYVTAASGPVTDDTTRIPVRMTLPTNQPTGSYVGTVVVSTTAVA